MLLLLLFFFKKRMLIEINFRICKNERISFISIRFKWMVAMNIAYFPFHQRISTNKQS